jgi:hypothetical protein
MSAAIAALAIGIILYGVLMSQQDAMLQMLQEAQRQRNASP